MLPVTQLAESMDLPEPGVLKDEFIITINGTNIPNFTIGTGNGMELDYITKDSILSSSS